MEQGGSDRSRWRRRGERGAALTEFAFAFPIFALLMLAIVDLGVHFGDEVEATHAAREAARAGSVARVGNETDCTLYLDPWVHPLTRELFCLAKKRTHMDPRDVRVKVFFEGINGRRTDNYQPYTRVASKATIVVCVQSAADSVSGVLSWVLDDKVHEAKALVKTGVPSGDWWGIYPYAAEETPLPGHDWSFCAPEDPNGTDAT